MTTPVSTVHYFHSTSSSYDVILGRHPDLRSRDPPSSWSSDSRTTPPDPPFSLTPPFLVEPRTWIHRDWRGEGVGCPLMTQLGLVPTRALRKAQKTLKCRPPLWTHCGSLLQCVHSRPGSDGEGTGYHVGESRITKDPKPLSGDRQRGGPRTVGKR